MVDINLIGEEESRQQQSYSGEAGFGQSINLDSDAPAGTSPGSYSSADFSELSSGSGNAKLYVILGALVIVIAAVIYFLIPEDESMEDMSTLTDPAGEMTSGGDQMDMGAADPAASADINAPEKVVDRETTTAADMDAFESMSQLEKKMLLSTRMSAYTVSALARAISDGAIFTLIRFSDNAFLAQFVTNSNSGITSAIDRISSDVDVRDIRKVSQGKFAATSRVQAIVAGAVDPETAPISYSGKLQDMSISELRSWIEQAARDNGLSLKTMNQSSEYTEAGFTVIPVQINLQGSMEGAIGFLDDLSVAAPALVMTKASLINKDPGARDQDSVSLVLVFNLYSY